MVLFFFIIRWCQGFVKSLFTTHLLDSSLVCGVDVLGEEAYHSLADFCVGIEDELANRIDIVRLQEASLSEYVEQVDCCSTHIDLSVLCGHLDDTWSKAFGESLEPGQFTLVFEQARELVENLYPC